MHGFLKQSTASQSRLVGPFIDDTDFKTLETGLTIANTDVKLSKNGGAVVNKNSGGGTHITNGMYALTFNATDTGTVGELTGSIAVAGALVAVFKFTILEEAIYDALFAASAAGFDANGKVVVVTNDDKTGYSISGTKTTLDALNDMSTAQVNAEVDNALNTAIPGSPTAGSVNERVKAIDDKLPTGTISDFDESSNNVTVGTNSDKTGYSISGTKTTLDALNDVSTAQVNTEVDSALNTAIPASPTANSVNERVKAIDDKLPTGTLSDFDESTNTVDIGKINGVAASAVKFERAASAMVTGTVDTATFTPTTTVFEVDDITEATADHFNGRTMVFTSGALAQQATDITDYVLANGKGKFTVTALTEAPANNVTLAIV